MNADETLRALDRAANDVIARLGFSAAVARKVVDSDQIAALLDSPEIAALVAELDALNWTGQKGYGARTMVGAYFVKSLFALPTWTRVVAIIAENAALRDAVGGTPSHWACYRFGKRCGSKALRDRNRLARTGHISTTAEAQVRYREALAAEIARAVAGNSELAELIAEQERDTRFGDRVGHAGIQSLDALVRTSNEDGSTRYELIGSDELDPAHVVLKKEEAARIRATVGNRTEEDLRRLDYRTLDYLGAKLQQEGLVSSISVTRAERVRIRDAEKHSGITALTHGSYGGRKKRREKILASRHSRPSRKPRKRWERIISADA